MKGIGIIGEMIPGVILGGILLGLVSSSLLLTTLSPCSSASLAKEASYSKAPATAPYFSNPSRFAFEKVWVYRGMKHLQCA
ncbi:MAG: hypothetical protein L7T84_01995 [Akkermansiaceae bacterium]|nr:hypothetical protein [Akkermansiaceae bacterium]